MYGRTFAGTDGWTLARTNGWTALRSTDVRMTSKEETAGESFTIFFSKDFWGVETPELDSQLSLSLFNLSLSN